VASISSLYGRAATSGGLKAPMLYFAAMVEKKTLGFQERRLPTYPIGLIVRVLLWSGRQVEAKVIRIETTALGTFLHVEFGEEVANITFNQIIGFYNFCFLKGQSKTLLSR
jgi:hypothetical protein